MEEEEDASVSVLDFIPKSVHLANTFTRYESNLGL